LKKNRLFPVALSPVTEICDQDAKRTVTTWIKAQPTPPGRFAGMGLGLL
jgi:hypothetical protein